LLQEVRAEASQRLDAEAVGFRAYRLETNKTISTLAAKVTAMEDQYRTAAIPSVEGKIKALERRIQEHEGLIRIGNTHTHTHSYTHTHTYIHTYTYIHTHSHTYTHTHSYTHIHTYTHSYAQWGGRAVRG
jgi:hypothetical protein